MNVMIFGGAGFIGTNMTKRCLDRGDKVICIDNLSSGRIENIMQFHDKGIYTKLIDWIPTEHSSFKYKQTQFCNKQFLFIEADITDNKLHDYLYRATESFYHIPERIDIIYNFACIASPEQYIQKPLETLRSSLAVDWICKLAYCNNAKLLHSSTSEVYGDPDEKHHPQSEDYYGNVNTVGPRSCYDEGKRVAETIIYEWKNQHNIDAKIIRIFNTYGPYMRPDDGRVVSNIITQILLREPLTIFGDGNQTRSFMYIDDLLDAIDLIVDSKEFGPFNVGNPKETTINNFVELALETSFEEDSIMIEHKELMQDDPKKRKPDITKIKTTFGWEPKISLKEGLEKTFDYFRKMYC